MIIRDADFSDARLQELLQIHLAGMHANSPPDSVYALDLSGLQRADVSLYTVWEQDSLLAMGALREVGPTQGEVKSMRTAQAHLRRGAAAFVLDHIIQTARRRGYRRLSLETGSGPAFDAALTLYRRTGFEDGPPFGDYEASAFNQFLHLDL